MAAGGHPHPPRSRRPGLAIGPLLGLLLLVSSAARPQSTPPPESIDLDNWAWVHGATQSVSLGGQSVQVVRLPISLPIRRPEEHPWGLRLRLPVSFGFHELEAAIGDRELRASFRTITVTPGLEAFLPVGRRWALRPFAELGPGKDLEGGEWALLYNVGLRSHARYSAGRWQITPGTQLELSGSRAADGLGRIDDFTIVGAGVDLQHPVGRVGQRELSASGYWIERWFPDSVRFLGLDGDLAFLDRQSEVGLTLGVSPRYRVLGLPLPRLGVGHRWGGPLRSWVVNFGFPLD